MNKIIFIFPSLKTGGGNRVMVELANCISLSKSVLVIYPFNSEEKSRYSFRNEVVLKGVGFCSKYKIMKLWNIFLILLFVNKYKRSHIFYSDPFISIFSIAIFNKHKYRFIQADDYRIFDDGFLLRSKLVLKIYKFFCLKSYKYKNKFIFNSKFVYDTFCMDSQRSDIEYKLVYPAIDHSIFKLKGDNTYLSREFSICLVARKHPWKGLINFINVWKRINNDLKNRISNVYLITQDDLSDFDLRGMSVINPNNDIEIVNIYNKSQIFISTSWWEGFGLPPLEAMSCGCACLISDSGGISEYAISDYNCLMFPPKNEELLLKNLILLIENESLRCRLSEEGIRTASKFSWKKSTDQLIQSIAL